MSELKGQVALITGGASGIGRAAARLFTSKGCRVILADQDRDGAAAALNELNAIDAGCGAYTPVDVAEADQVAAAVRDAIARFGRLDILLNSAAIYPTFPSLLETPDADWDKVMRINLRGTFLFCKHALPAMIEAGAGAIVNLSSISGLRGTTYSVPYAVAKAGVIQLTKTIAAQYASKGIRANCIVPGLVDSPMSRKVTGSTEEFGRYVQQIPAGRAGTPEDIAGLALFLVSAESAYINGTAIVIDGGIMAR
jgi:NAD(P)-dependent dehydrogenase (short-subunit alcohol dehydrogenase family)